MDNIIIDDFVVEQNGLVYNNGKLVEGIPSKNCSLIYSITGRRESIEKTICKSIFGLFESDFIYLDIGHRNKSWIDNSFYNLKIFPKKDFRNKTNNFIAIYDDVPYFFENGIAKYTSSNIRVELNIT